MAGFAWCRTLRGSDLDQENIQSQLNAEYHLTLLKAATALTPTQARQLSMPHLISVSREYLDSPLRVMFVGKETNGWLGHLNFGHYASTPDAIVRLLARYDKQINEPNAKGAFSATHLRISEEFAGGRKQAVMWSNLLKMDWAQGKTDSRTSISHSVELRDLSARLLQIEVKLLKPHVIFFGTGASYDSLIKATFGNDLVESNVVVPRALWTFKVGDTFCCRIRHPQARPTNTFMSSAHYFRTAFEAVHTHLERCGARRRRCLEGT